MPGQPNTPAKWKPPNFFEGYHPLSQCPPNFSATPPVGSLADNEVPDTDACCPKSCHQGAAESAHLPDVSKTDSFRPHWLLL